MPTPPPQQTNSAPTGSRTQTQAHPPTNPPPATPGILHLQGRPSASTTSPPRSVQWASDTLDNEHLNRKKSKICCIYHRPKAVGESSSESSSSSDSEASSDSDSDDGHGHGKGPCPAGDHSHGHGDRKGKKPRRKPSPNAYERQPRPRNMKRGPNNGNGGNGNSGGAGPSGSGGITV